MIYRYEIEENGKRAKYKILALGDQKAKAVYIEEQDYLRAMDNMACAI